MSWGTPTDEEYEVIRRMRLRGMAVVVFNADELHTADAEQVEDRLVELGWDAIGYLQAMASRGLD